MCLYIHNKYTEHTYPCKLKPLFYIYIYIYIILHVIYISIICILCNIVVFIMFNTNVQMYVTKTKRNVNWAIFFFFCRDNFFVHIVYINSKQTCVIKFQQNMILPSVCWCKQGPMSKKILWTNNMPQFLQTNQLQSHLSLFTADFL